MENVIYLDNAATVYPKPAEIMDRMLDMYKKYGVNPGRSGFDLCLVGGELIAATRAQLTRFFNGTDPNRLCFAHNASDALNILIHGLVNEGDHVVSTVLEHNSVIRPLNHLAKDNVITRDFVPCGADCRLDPDEFKRHLRKNTRLAVVNHGSNVIGTIQPLQEIGRLCRERDILLVVDTAQTAGVAPIDMQAMHIDALAFTGHKSLLGPTGIGGLYVREGVTVKITRSGGTGVKSAYPFHLEEYPYRLEVGTSNTLGIIGLHLAQEYLAKKGVAAIYAHEMQLLARLQEAFLRIDGVTVHGATGLEDRLPVVSVTVRGRDPADVGSLLDVDHGIATRTGLQCAPLIHEHMGTAPRGTVRFSIGPANTEQDVDAAIEALTAIAASAPRS
ncbi:MAG: aminotransferase class V-fold PLP-dependent enzyme [Planctomycetes bacterium]|nr:aminotransferase class V-fold PLP-dependent enzyme [Planctomycetota bacterium]